ncbi:MAG: LacI family transcriptional regulator [Anaerolineae bacterium]|nr:LacI family transcriptional regulator [Anaerolineae bacterium]
MNPPVTQREIARKLGLSIATVSRALNDQPGVSPEIRAQVLEAARELGYFPHLPARSLVTATTHTVAFVFHSEHAASEDPFYPIIMAGAESYLSQQRYHVLMSTIDDQILENPHLFTPVSQGMVDGLILAGPTITPSFILAMLSAGIPLVLVDNSLPQTPVNCVLNDDEGGAYAATSHLVEHGYSRIACLSGPEEWVSNRERCRGYHRAMYEAGLAPVVVHEQETTIASGERAMQRLLEAHPDVQAICAVNDSVAIGAIRAAARMGRRTPEDLAVVGFDDISWAQLNDPPLSTVHVFKRQIGALAAQRLLDCIQNPDAPPVRVLVSTQLVLRASCGH